MTDPYPIVKQIQLSEPVRRGVFGLLGQRRERSEIPALQPHEVLVYRVNGRFVMDDGRLGLDDDDVINATSVSVVNMRREAEVATNFTIDSQDASQFSVYVNFVCTVTDPIRVVKDGQANAGVALLSYLKGYQRLFELGLTHPLSELNALRREAGHHIKAYMTVMPPEIAGLSIDLGNVQVMTPDEIAAHQKDLRKAKQDHDIAAMALESETALERRKLAAQSELGEGRLANAKTTAETIGNDPNLALHLAYVSGELSAGEIADRIQAREEERERIEREDAKEAAELDRRRRADALAIDIEIMREFSKRGHFDGTNIDVDDLLRRLRGQADSLAGNTGVPTSERRAAIAAGDDDAKKTADDDHQLKDEDGD
jgi:hypothetical protein